MTNNEVLGALEEARRLVAEVGWCQRALGRTADGTHCSAVDPDAVSFCMHGAVLRACLSQSVPTPTHGKIIYELGMELAPLGIANWNDATERTREDVVTVFDQVIARLGAPKAER